MLKCALSRVQLCIMAVALVVAGNVNGQQPERNAIAAKTQNGHGQVRSDSNDFERLRRIADFALIPPKIIHHPSAAYDFDNYDYLMTPGIERTPHGRLWSMIGTGCDCDNGDIFPIAVTSDDNGETWSKPRLAIDGRAAELLPYFRTVVDFTLWTDPNGRLWVFFLQAMNHWDGRGGIWATCCDNPDAADPVFAAPKYIGPGLSLNKPIILSTGEWVLPAYLVQHFNGFRPFINVFPELDSLKGVNMYLSADSGSTWILRSVVRHPRPDWTEPMYVEKKDGTIWMMARTLDGIMECFSTDRGYTWTKPASTRPRISSTNGRFFFRRLQTGNLLLVKYGKALDSFDKSKYNGRNYLSAWLSEDDGTTWKGGLLIDDRENVSYPDGTQAPDGTIYISYDHIRGPGDMLLAHFTEQDVLAGKLVDPRSKLKMLIARAGKKANRSLPPREPPGVVIEHRTQESETYIGSPSICLMPDGKYIVSHDVFGPRSNEFYSAQTVIYSSSDKGKTWEKISFIDGQFWSNLFYHNGVLYLMGTNRHHGNFIIRRSLDSGHTWSVPYDSKHGLLLEGEYATAPVPVVIHNGRIWRALEYATSNTTQWGRRYSAMVISAPANSDLLDAANWKTSNRLAFDSTYLGGKFNAWLEGNIVVGPGNALFNILRVDVPPGQDEVAAFVRIDKSGKKVSFDPASGFVRMPGASKKFTIRFDAKTGKYWALLNEVGEDIKQRAPAGVRNRVALASSGDLMTWKVQRTLLWDEDADKHGFQYIDWQIEGEDIVFVARTAYDDSSGGAHNFHDANFLTFHRVANFRNLKEKQ